LLSRAEALERAPSSNSIGGDKFGRSEDVHIIGYIKNTNRKSYRIIYSKAGENRRWERLKIDNLEKEKRRS